MTVNIGLIVLVFGSLIAGIMLYYATNAKLSEDARFMNGFFSFVVILGTIIVTIVCFVNKLSISTSELVQFHHSPAISEKYSALAN